MIATLIGFVLLAHGLLFLALLWFGDNVTQRPKITVAAFVCLLGAGLLLK